MKQIELMKAYLSNPVISGGLAVVIIGCAIMAYIEKRKRN